LYEKERGSLSRVSKRGGKEKGAIVGGSGQAVYTCNLGKKKRRGKLYPQNSPRPGSDAKKEKKKKRGGGLSSNTACPKGSVSR